ncbi:MAG: pilus assembly FimT family protein [Opitutales bacterium]
MILATGSSRRGSAARGFTIIEILLVSALIAVASGLVIANFTAFANRGQTTSPEEVLRTAIRKARFTAATNRITTELRYDREKGQLEILPDNETFEINEHFGPDGRGEITFYLIPPAEGLQAFPNPDTSSLETAQVTFAPDRSSSPFLAEIDTGRGTPVRLRFDPFSGVVITKE